MVLFRTASLGLVSWGSRQLRIEGWKFTRSPPCLKKKKRKREKQKEKSIQHARALLICLDSELNVCIWGTN